MGSIIYFKKPQLTQQDGLPQEAMFTEVTRVNTFFAASILFNGSNVVGIVRNENIDYIETSSHGFKILPE